MERFHGDPHPSLAPYVNAYWGIDRPRPDLRNFFVTPDTYLELIFFAERPVVVEGHVADGCRTSC